MNDPALDAATHGPLFGIPKFYETRLADLLLELTRAVTAFKTPRRKKKIAQSYSWCALA
jgi:hypothetical protein